MELKNYNNVNLQFFNHKCMGMFQETTTGTNDRGNSMSNGRVMWKPKTVVENLLGASSIPAIKTIVADMNDIK